MDQIKMLKNRICRENRYAQQSVLKVAFDGFCSMETLRYHLPRRSVFCLFFICMMFIAFAFYTFFSDSKNSSIPPFKFVDTNEEEISFMTSNTLVLQGNGFSFGKRETPDSDLQQSDSASSVKTKLYNALNTSSNEKSKNGDSVHVQTKYLVNPSPSTTTSTTSVPLTTAAQIADTCSSIQENTKLILLWTSFFDYWGYLPKERFSRCSRCKNCQVTTDRSKLLQSDAVIFHARDMSFMDIPPVRLPHQRWIFYSLESPPYSDFSGLQHTQNMFNWTMTYRSDSDIPTPYGYVSKVRPPHKLDMVSLQLAWSNKSRSVVWMSSHCPTHGGRDFFVMELRKYIDVDVYGTCGTSVCRPGEPAKCLEEFAQKYKFFLAFENSICSDYITEKFFRTLSNNIIPVVFGGANYGKFSPPGSFIDALNFKSPKHLAFFLSGVGKDFKIYSEFFKWRENYAVTLGNKKECQLCSLLHRKSLKPKSYKNLREWWVKGSNCKTWTPKL